MPLTKIGGVRVFFLSDKLQLWEDGKCFKEDGEGPKDFDERPLVVYYKCKDEAWADDVVRAQLVVIWLVRLSAAST
jgi:hypothetical protein